MQKAGQDCVLFVTLQLHTQEREKHSPVQLMMLMQQREEKSRWRKLSVLEFTQIGL